MVKIILFWVVTLGFSLFASAQSAEEVIQKVFRAQANLQHLSYNTHRIDTFLSGEVWDHKGLAKMSIDQGDPSVGFRFWGKRNDLNIETMYDGHTALEIDHEKKTYLAVTDRSKFYGILGYTGARMVMKEIAKLDTAGATKFEVKQTPAHFQLRLLYPDKKQHNIAERYKWFLIDKETMLPIEMINHFLMGGKKQSEHFILSDINLNGSAATFDYARLQVPGGYSQEVPGSNQALDALMGKPAPAFALTGFDGKPFSSDVLKEKVVLLDFWEVWCGPCIASMPKVQQLARQYKEDGLVVMGIMNNQKNLEAAKILLAQKQITLPMLLGNERVKADFSVVAVPLYVLMDRKGNIVFTEQGFSDNLQAAIRKALRN